MMELSTETTLSIYQVLGLIIGGGGLGGLLDYFNRFKMNNDNKKLCFQDTTIGIYQFFSLAAISIALGCGGALAIQFAMLSVGKFDIAATIESIMWLLTTSVVAGFSGRRMLNLVSSKLEEQIGEAKRDAGKAKEEAIEAKEEAEEVLLITRASAAVGPNSTCSERISLLSEIKSFLNEKPTHRYLTILAGRIHRKDGNYEGGIQVLTHYLEIKDKLNEQDRDYADVLYNRACYRALLASEATYNNEMERKECLKDLRRSVELSSENASDAASDSDFDGIKELPEFIKIINHDPK